MAEISYQFGAPHLNSLPLIQAGKHAVGRY
jgi:hypothetical protein